jgi:hypothetical protein
MDACDSSARRHLRPFAAVHNDGLQPPVFHVFTSRLRRYCRGVRGRVIEVPAEDNTNRHLEAGDVLFKIDPKPYEYRVAEKRAGLADAEANVAQLKASVDQASATVEKAKAELQLAQENYNRQSELFQKNVVAQATLDTATRNRDAAKQAPDYGLLQIVLSIRKFVLQAYDGRVFSLHCRTIRLPGAIFRGDNLGHRRQTRCNYRHIRLGPSCGPRSYDHNTDCRLTNGCGPSRRRYRRELGASGRERHGRLPDRGGA